MFRYHCVFALGLLPSIVAAEGRRLMAIVFTNLMQIVSGPTISKAMLENLLRHYSRRDKTTG